MSTIISEGHKRELKRKKLILEKNTANEDKNNLIFEAGGIGFSDYIPEIYRIVLYVAAYISKYPSENKKWNIDIPKAYTKSFKNFDDLSIHVIVEDVGEKLVKIGSGDSKLNAFPMASIENGKFVEPENINIQCYSNGNKLYEKTLMSILIHELNHKAEELGREKRFELNPMQINAQTYEFLDSTKLSDDENLNKYILNLFYVLFDNSELNAFSASVYGDLKGMQSKRENFKKDIRKTHAYSWFYTLSKGMHLLSTNDKVFWTNLQQAISLSTIKHKGHYKTVGEFRTWFINRSQQLLDKFYKKILTTAGYYYATQEDQEKGGIKIIERKK